LKLDEHKVRGTRERRGLTLAMVAQRAGTSKNTVLSAEHGADIRPTTARKIAEALNVEIDDLLLEQAHPLGQAPPSNQPPLFNGEQERRAIEALDTHLGKLEAALDRGEMDREAATLHLYIVQVVGPTIPAMMRNVAVETALRPMAERFAELGRRVLAEARRLGVKDTEAEAVVFDIEQYRRAG
jgi:DNA-binding XRE family transcriptional regulator